MLDHHLQRLFQHDDFGVSQRDRVNKGGHVVVQSCSGWQEFTKERR